VRLFETWVRTFALARRKVTRMVRR